MKRMIWTRTRITMTWSQKTWTSNRLRSFQYICVAWVGPPSWGIVPQEGFVLPGPDGRSKVCMAIVPIDEFISARQLRFHVRRWSPTRPDSALPPIVLLHGLASATRIWDFV